LGRAIVDLSVSLDGYAAGPGITLENPLGDNGERLHDWMFAGATETGRRVQDEIFADAGAVVMGRGVFDVGKPYWDPDPHTFHGLPVFVLTHRPGEPIADPGGSTFTFVSDGIEHALASAREAAGGGDVVIGGGPTIGRAFLAAGLVAELRLHVVHILLGAGTPLFAPGRGRLERLEAIRVVEDAGVTHFRFVPSPSPRAG
jgi:dihydrofolate reductase